MTVASKNIFSQSFPNTLSNGGTINLEADSQISAPFSSMKNSGVINVGTGASILLNELTGRGALNFVDGLQSNFRNMPASAGVVTATAGGFRVNQSQMFTVDKLNIAGQLRVGSAGTLQIRPDGTAVGASRVGSLVLGKTDTTPASGSVDVADNLLVVTDPGQFETVLALRADGLVASGLKSAIAQANPRLDLGIVRADEIFVGGTGTLLGQFAEGDDVLIRATLRGDSNVDTTVNFDDLVKLAQHYNLAGQGWGDGDTNYDGNVNFDDLVSVAQNYGQSYIGGAIVPSGGAIAGNFTADWALAQSLVPEPASLAAVAAAVALTSVRRRAK